MRRIFEAVRADGWPVAFAFVFDDFWTIARTPRITSFLGKALGEACLQNTVVWAHWVPGERVVAGWRPARGLPGCRRNVPLPVDSAVGHHRRERLHVPAAWRIVARDFDGYGGTPRPAADGFSARAAGRDRPAGFCRFDYRLARRRSPLGRRQYRRFRTAPLPPFRLRLFAIVKALREYTQFEPMLTRYLPLAERIFAETADASLSWSNAPWAS